MSKYSIGIDFGTLSGRALVVDIESGEELAVATFDYPHGVMTETIPYDKNDPNYGKKLPPDWALQYPGDYVETVLKTVPEAVKKAGISPDDVIGIGVDFTACTPLPVKADGTPLCMTDEFKNNPHAYVKLWKHHAAQDKAAKLNEIAEKRGEKWLSRYGGKISSEWLIPKLWQVLDEAPEVYAAADYFIEAGDWIVWQLCGKQTRNACAAGYKAMWSKSDGYPSEEFFAALDSRLENVVADKLNCEIQPQGSRAGGLTAEMAKLTGLREGTAVAVCNVDAHVCFPAVKIDGVGKMLDIIGTSSCHMLLGREEIQVDGICGYTIDGIVPGYCGYEAGQSCVGDHFAWFTENCVPAGYLKEAEKLGMNIHQYLTSLAEKYRPGESGLVALDWWNGNRSVLVDVDLTGLMLGMTLATKPEEMYRALIEATAYGTRVIVEAFRSAGIPVDEFYAAGGIALKNPMLMQIYSDVLNMPIYIAGSAQGPALGSAIFGSVAAGEKNGGYDDVFTAGAHMGKLKSTVYRPSAENAAVYDKLFAEYKKLHDYFGVEGNNVMKRLKKIKAGQSK